MNSLLPPNATVLERAIEATAASALDLITTPLREIWDPTDCPLAILPYLASSLSIEGWNAAWSEELKRAKVAEALPFHRRKGTRGAVRSVLDTFDPSMTIDEWFGTGGAPYTFAVTLPLTGNDVNSGSAFVERVVPEIERAKPVRAHLTFRQTLPSEAGLGLTGAARSVIYGRLPMAAELVEDSAAWVGVLLTENGEPMFTEDGDRLEFDA